ncbi:MAG TPA: hypothetical protein VFQ70_01310 [Candidatus Saccharimonadaceae bacterium]|nr:hypothetical protein [Candidatus Saccharimonadaceae bacterium]
MPLSPKQQVELASNAVYGDMPQERVDAIQAAAEDQRAHFESARETPTANELGKLAANDAAAKEFAIQQVAMDPDVDQDRVDAMQRHQ